MIAFIFSLISAIAAEAGGILALRYRKKLGLLLGFTAGALIGLVAFDLLPEIFEISSSGAVDIIYPMIALVTGFLLFHIVEKTILLHHSHEHEYIVHQHPHVGYASAAALIGHSFLDGASIGFAFQLNNAAGFAVALAVIAHRFADGFNGVSLMMHHKNTLRQSHIVLGLVAIAPILGTLFTVFYELSESFLGIYLGFFAGFLIYISASDILPQAHNNSKSRLPIVFTILGAVTMFIITRAL